MAESDRPPSFAVTPHDWSRRMGPPHLLSAQPLEQPEDLRRPTKTSHRRRKEGGNPVANGSILRCALQQRAPTKTAGLPLGELLPPKCRACPYAERLSVKGAFK